MFFGQNHMFTQTKELSLRHCSRWNGPVIGQAIFAQFPMLGRCILLFATSSHVNIYWLQNMFWRRSWRHIIRHIYHPTTKHWTNTPVSLCSIRFRCCVAHRSARAALGSMRPINGAWPTHFIGWKQSSWGISHHKPRPKRWNWEEKQQYIRCCNEGTQFVAARIFWMVKLEPSSGRPSSSSSIHFVA